MTRTKVEDDSRGTTNNDNKTNGGNSDGAIQSFSNMRETNNEK